MENLQAVLSHPFTWGFALGALFFVLSFWSHLKTKREFRRFQKHLGDKLELEAKQYEMVRKEKEELAKENENLRVKVGQLNERPDHRVARDLEVMARAEKRLLLGAPGFAPAWETAKADAMREMGEEERGRSIPKRIMTRLFGNGTDAREVEAQPMLEAGSDEGPGHPSPSQKSSASPASTNGGDSQATHGGGDPAANKSS